MNFSVLRESFVVDLSAFIFMFMFLCCFDDFKRNPEVVWEGWVESPLISGGSPLFKITSVE
jgi:hypothetical protein